MMEHAVFINRNAADQFAAAYCFCHGTARRVLAHPVYKQHALIGWRVSIKDSDDSLVRYATENEAMRYK